MECSHKRTRGLKRLNHKFMLHHKAIKTFLLHRSFFGCENKPEKTCSKVTDADVALFGLKTFTVGQESANKELESYKKLLWNVT